MNREIITVTSVRWNGEEWWIGTRGLKNDLPGEPFEYWNDLSRFWEACHHIRREPGPPGGKGPTRKGPPQGTELEPSDA